MTLIAVPNVSEGRDASLLRRLEEGVAAAGARVLDVHTDALHNRSVFTLAGDEEPLVVGAVALARGCLEIDLTHHQGLHPRLGGLDVCPFVPVDSPMDGVIAVARRAGRAIAERTNVPVYLYEAAAARPEERSLPSLRRGGLNALVQRAQRGLEPDFGPARIDPRRGVVCVGARGVLIAFNVVLECDASMAKKIASRTRTSGGGPPGIRALGWALGPGLAQVSMNLISPDETGVDEAFGHVAAEAERAGVGVASAEIVGLPPQRYMPDPKKEAARLLVRPGRSLEAALRS